jgi:hypothetical protein
MHTAPESSVIQRALGPTRPSRAVDDLLDSRRNCIVSLRPPHRPLYLPPMRLSLSDEIRTLESHNGHLHGWKAVKDWGMSVMIDRVDHESAQGDEYENFKDT